MAVCACGVEGVAVWAIGDVWGNASVEEDLDVFGGASLGGGYEEGGEVCRDGFCAGRVEGLFFGFFGG